MVKKVTEHRKMVTAITASWGEGGAVSVQGGNAGGNHQPFGVQGTLLATLLPVLSQFCHVRKSDRGNGKPNTPLSRSRL